MLRAWPVTSFQTPYRQQTKAHPPSPCTNPLTGILFSHQKDSTTVPQTQIILAYKNFAANRFVSHIGLGVTAMNSAKSLRAMGHNAEVWPIVSSQELRTRLSAPIQTEPATHVVISAPWIPTLELASLANDFPDTHS